MPEHTCCVDGYGDDAFIGRYIIMQNDCIRRARIGWFKVQSSQFEIFNGFIECFEIDYLLGQ